MVRPETLLSFSDYVEDFKARVEIHQYEVKELREDLSQFFNFITDKVYYNLTNR